MGAENNKHTHGPPTLIEKRATTLPYLIPLFKQWNRALWILLKTQSTLTLLFHAPVWSVSESTPYSQGLTRCHHDRAHPSCHQVSPLFGWIFNIWKHSWLLQAKHPSCLLLPEFTLFFKILKLVLPLTVDIYTISDSILGTYLHLLTLFMNQNNTLSLTADLECACHTVTFHALNTSHHLF